MAGENKKTEKAASEASGDRIAKVIARAGLCSRRDAEAWILAGRVSLNGKKLQSPAVNVQPHDDVRVDGKPLPQAEKTRLFRYHKPRGLVTTAKDPEGRPTVFDNLPDGMPRVISVGRLDLNSEGLLLLTNDGELARRLELPATGWVRRYRVRVNGRIDPASLTRLAKGIEIEGIRYGAIEAVLDRQQGDNAWLTMSLTEGKNREIRKVCAFFGWTVSRLIRLSYGPFQLGHLEKGEIEEVPGKVIRDQLGQPGTPAPLRPQQAQGGKARPPKPRTGEQRSASSSHRREEDDGRSKRFTAKSDQRHNEWKRHNRQTEARITDRAITQVSADARAADRVRQQNASGNESFTTRKKLTQTRQAKPIAGKGDERRGVAAKPSGSRPVKTGKSEARSHPGSKKHAHRQRRP